MGIEAPNPFPSTKKKRRKTNVQYISVDENFIENLGLEFLVLDRRHSFFCQCIENSKHDTKLSQLIEIPQVFSSRVWHSCDELKFQMKAIKLTLEMIWLWEWRGGGERLFYSKLVQLYKCWISGEPVYCFCTCRLLVLINVKVERKKTTN